MTTGKQFREAVRGIPAYCVTSVLNRHTPGTNWHRCSKDHIAREFDLDNHRSLQRIDLDDFVLMAKAWQAKVPYWYDVDALRHAEKVKRQRKEAFILAHAVDLRAALVRLVRDTEDGDALAAARALLKRIDEEEAREL